MTDQDQQSFITPEDLANLRARDGRWKIVDLSIRIDAELRDSLIINLIIEAAARRAEEAKDALSEVDANDVKKIISLQADVQRAKLIGEILRDIKNSGNEAYAALKAEESINLENRS